MKIIFKAIGLLLLFVASAFAQPKTISYQAQLNTDISNQAVTLTLYADAAGDSVLWQDIMVASTTAHILDLELGANPRNLLPTLSGESWLGVKIAADPEMRPLAHLAAVPYALTAGIARTLSEPHIKAFVVDGVSYPDTVRFVTDTNGYLRFVH